MSSLRVPNTRASSRVPTRVDRRGLLVLAAVTALVAPAAAQAPHAPYPRGWPQPAAGPSASGDTELLLTFDDGPDPETTPVVLDQLAARGVHAVFFQVGWRFRRGDIARARAIDARLVREGHIIGNHTVDHAQLCSVPEVLGKLQITMSRELLEQAAGMPVPWFRTPYGARCPRVERILGELGLAHFHWDIDPQEWRGLGAKATVAKVTRAIARLQGRGVLLMHDTKFATRYALPKILDWIEAEDARRRKKGRPGIRFISGAQLAREHLAPTLGWLADAYHKSKLDVTTALVATVP